jgi:hypothetical protein
MITTVLCSELCAFRREIGPQIEDAAAAAPYLRKVRRLGRWITDSSISKTDKDED